MPFTSLNFDMKDEPLEQLSTLRIPVHGDQTLVGNTTSKSKPLLSIPLVEYSATRAGLLLNDEVRWPADLLTQICDRLWKIP